MPSMFDIAYAVFFAVGVLGLAGFYFERWLKGRMAAGVPSAQLTWCRSVVAVLWALAIATILLWQRAGRPWTVLGLVPPNDWRLWVGLALMALVAGLVVRQNVRVQRLTPERIERLRQKIASVELFLPHDEREYRWFMLLSCTAGCCEELLYRGFLTWVVASYAGVAAAVVIVSVAFGAAHAYQGAKGIVRAGAGAVIFSGIVLASGWLIPAMVIHALVDISGGVLGFRLVRRDPPTMMQAA